MALSERLQHALADHKLIRLDMGCGKWRQEGDSWYGIDQRTFDCVDLVHDLEDTPYPLPEACAQVILASHIIEHIKPWKTIEVLNEWWRLLLPGGRLMLATPYCTSPGYYQDPTHCNPWSEVTPHYFDPDCKLPGCMLYQIYEPAPWQIERNEFISSGNMEIILVKRERA